VELTVATGNPVMMPRVLEVKKGQLCWIVGTVYMDMALKPNILEDIGKDVRALIITDIDRFITCLINV
jgi:hypothetical protein